jgi:uncharacterized protein YfdQ (DUF2303 family)
MSDTDIEIETGLGTVLGQARDLVEDYIRPEVRTVVEPGTGIEALAIVTRSGIEAVPAKVFDESRDKPRFRTGTATFFDLDSFIAHVNRFRDSDSIVFANNDRSKPSLLSVLDYHREGSSSDPAFLQHRGRFAFPLSDEWKAWNEVNGENMEMVEFAAFLEDRIIDVLPAENINLSGDQRRFVEALGGEQRIASPAKLMELSRGLQVFEHSEVSSAAKLASGESKMTFSSQHVDAQGGELKVPSLFVIAIPVFVNGPTYQVLVRLRYRKVGAKLVFFTELWRTDRVFDHAFDEAIAQVGTDTGLPVLLGEPERA